MSFDIQIRFIQTLTAMSFKIIVNSEAYVPWATNSSDFC